MIKRIVNFKEILIFIHKSFFIYFCDTSKTIVAFSSVCLCVFYNFSRKIDVFYRIYPKNLNKKFLSNLTLFTNKMHIFRYFLFLHILIISKIFILLLLLFYVFCILLHGHFLLGISIFNI